MVNGSFFFVRILESVLDQTNGKLYNPAFSEIRLRVDLLHVVCMRRMSSLSSESKAFLSRSTNAVQISLGSPITVSLLLRIKCTEHGGVFEVFRKGHSVTLSSWNTKCAAVKFPHSESRSTPP